MFSQGNNVSSLGELEVSTGTMSRLLNGWAVDAQGRRGLFIGDAPANAIKIAGRAFTADGKHYAVTSPTGTTLRGGIRYTASGAMLVTGAAPTADSRIVRDEFGAFMVSADGAVHLAYTFDADLTSSLTPGFSIADGTPTFTRATTATVMGYGPAAVSGDAMTLLTVLSGEARFQGARRISPSNWTDVYAKPKPYTATDGQYGVLQGVSGGYFSTPDAPSIRPAGDFDVRVRVALSDWPPSAQQAFMAKNLATGNQRSWTFTIDTSGRFNFFLSADGTATTVAVNSGVAPVIADGASLWVRVTFDSDNGAGGSDVMFYTSADGVIWTQLGTTQTTAGVATAFGSTADLTVGAFNAGGVTQPASGIVYSAELYDGIDGTLVADFNPADYSTGTTFASSTTGETWTINGQANIVADSSVPIAATDLDGYLSEGQRTQYLGVTGTPATQTTASLGTGTYTLWVVGSGSALASGGTATITGAAPASDGVPNTFTVTVAGTVTVTVTGSLTRFQLENGAFASSYIENTGAAGTSVTRNADILTYPSAGNVVDAQGTLYAEAKFASPFASNSANQFVLEVSDGTTANRNQMNRTATTGDINLGSFSGGVIQGDFATAAGVLGPIKAAYSYQDNNLRAAVNGTTYGPDTSATVPTGLTTIEIGHRVGGVAFLFGTVKNVRIYNRALSDAQLQGLTT